MAWQPGFGYSHRLDPQVIEVLQRGEVEHHHPLRVPRYLHRVERMDDGHALTRRLIVLLVAVATGQGNQDTHYEKSY